MQQKFVYGLNPSGFHKITYYEWGAADAQRTIVCVHGLTRNSHDFDRLAAALEHEYRLICIDVVGRGDSDWLADPALYGYPQYLADMAVVLARTGARQVDWIGTSMGGLIGIILAGQPNSPIRKLILNDVGPFLSQAAMARIAHYISSVPPLPDLAAATAYIRAIYQNVGPCTDADYDAMVEHSIRPLPEGGYGLKYDPTIAMSFAAIKGDVDLWASYERIACPTLVLRGALSDVLSSETADAMTKRGPCARLLTVPNIGHYPGLMDKMQIDQIQDFLSH